MTSTPGTPAIEGWFTTGESPALLGSRCTGCARTYFPPTQGYCRNPACDGEEFDSVELARRGTVWSYTDAQYKPPPPYIPDVPDGAEFEPFALALVELPEGLAVLGQVARGYGVADLRVGTEVELVVERLYADETGERTIWRWKPVTGSGAAASTAQDEEAGR